MELKILGGLKPDKSFVSTNWPFQKDHFIPQFSTNQKPDLKATVEYATLGTLIGNFLGILPSAISGKNPKNPRFGVFTGFANKGSELILNRIWPFWSENSFFGIIFSITVFGMKILFWNENISFCKNSDEFSKIIGGYFVFEERNGIMMRPVWKLALEENESVARWILV